MDPHDEPRLVARIQTGDAAAFESLFRAYAAQLATLANSYLKSRDDAEDVVQALFVWLWTNRHSFRPEHGVRAYLFGAVRNRALNLLRNAGTHERALQRLGADGDPVVPPADAALEASELRAIVEHTVAAMSPRCREVFTLVRTSRLSYAEVAAILGITPKTVEVHMGRALAILRTRLGPHFER
jgi:RNA polymerase sigma-70 factor (ECF subfamily)